MSPYRIACLGALVCTVVAWILWGPWGGIAVAAPCVILLLIALPHALGAADDVGATEVSLGRLTIGVSRWDGTVLHDPDPEWPDWIAGIVGVIFAALAIGGSIQAYHEFGLLGPIGMLTMFGGLYAVVLLGLTAVF